MTEWILKKRGLFYRPNDCGYTGIRDHADRYTEEEARARAVNGVTMMRLADAPEFSEMCYDDLARKHLSEQRDKLRDALTLVRGIIKDGAMTGFNCHDGDWADRLFASQATTHAALHIQQRQEPK